MDFFDFLKLPEDTKWNLITPQPQQESVETPASSGNNDSNIFQDFTESDQKIYIWKKARNDIITFFDQEFIPSLQRASALWKISYSETKDFDNFEDQANAYVHLDKLNFKESDCLRFLPFISNFHKQIQFVTIMKPEVLEKYIGVIRKWLKSFYFCRFDTKCTDSKCRCHEEYFQRAFNRINFNNLSLAKLFAHSKPADFFTFKLFGKLIEKSIEILRDLDHFIPPYSEIFGSKSEKFLDLFFHKFPDLDFSISRASGVTSVTVQNDFDRFNSALFSQKYTFNE